MKYQAIDASIEYSQRKPRNADSPALRAYRENANQRRAIEAVQMPCGFFAYTKRIPNRVHSASNTLTDRAAYHEISLPWLPILGDRA